MATLTDAQKVVRNDTAKRMADALEKMVPALGGIPHAPNLLDNWYFVGGGSQLGDGVFPINQRGQTSYQGAVFGVDRWKDGNTNISVTLAGEHLSINNADQSNTRYLTQYLQSPDMLRGKTVTGSILLANGELYTGTATIPETIPDDDTAITLKVFDTNRIRLANLTNGSIRFDISVKINSSLLVKAVKLELGSYQTLAHQENGVWVLNEIPSWAEEMEKCMRFYYPLPAFFRVNVTYRSTGNLDFPLTLPVRMQGRIVLNAPAMVVSASTGTDGTLVDQTDFTFSIQSTGTSNGIVTVRATKANHGLLSASVILMRPGAGAYLSTEQ